MKTRIINVAFIQVLVFVLLLLSIHPSHSNALIYDYSYIGNHLFFVTQQDNSLPPVFTTKDFVAINIQTAQPLNANTLNQYGVPIIPYSLSMQIGTLDLTLAQDTYGFINCIIDPVTGLPIQWYSSITLKVSEVYTTIHSENITDHELGSNYDVMAWDWAGVSNSPGNPGSKAINYGSNLNNPGQWALTIISEPFVPVPEPATLFLLCTGLMVFWGFLALKRKKQVE